MYAQKGEDIYRDKMYGLQKEGLAHKKTMGLANLNIAEDAAREAKKRNKTAKALGYANVGLSAAFGGAKAYPALKEMGGDVMDWASPSAQPGGGVGPVGTPGSAGMSSVSGGSPMDWISDNFLGPISSGIQKFGGAIGGVWDGLYNNVIGDVIDIDWTEGFGAGDAIDFGW